MEKQLASTSTLFPSSSRASFIGDLRKVAHGVMIGYLEWKWSGNAFANHGENHFNHHHELFRTVSGTAANSLQDQMASVMHLPAVGLRRRARHSPKFGEGCSRRTTNLARAPPSPENIPTFARAALSSLPERRGQVCEHFASILPGLPKPDAVAQ